MNFADREPMFVLRFGDLRIDKVVFWNSCFTVNVVKLRGFRV
jgi:hypothetical protein